jgi:hypothetical protein
MIGHLPGFMFFTHHDGQLYRLTRDIIKYSEDLALREWADASQDPHDEKSFHGV